MSIQEVSQDNRVDILEFLGPDPNTSLVDVNPMLLVERIQAINPDFNISSYLLEGLSLARRHKTIKDTPAHIFWKSMEKIAVYWYNLFVRFGGEFVISGQVPNTVLKEDFEKSVPNISRICYEDSDYGDKDSKYFELSFPVDNVEKFIADTKEISILYNLQASPGEERISSIVFDKEKQAEYYTDLI